MEQQREGGHNAVAVRDQGSGREGGEVLKEEHCLRGAHVDLLEDCKENTRTVYREILRWRNRNYRDSLLRWL